MTKKELEEKVLKLEKEIEELKLRTPIVLPQYPCLLPHYPQNPWSPYGTYPTIIC